MRNDACTLFAILLTLTTTARSAPGSWFPASPCTDDASQAAVPVDGRLLLSVHYQPEAAPHDVVLLLGADHRWRAPADEWHQWTTVAPQMDSADGDRWVIIESGPALAMRIDACTSEMWIDADPGRLHETNLNSRSTHPVARAGYGGFVNLNLNYGGLVGRNEVNSIVDLGAFGPAGAGRSDFFVDNDAVRRLDTYWLHDDPHDAFRLRLGDSITHAADWETPVRFGGVQWGTDFSLQPDRITFPLPSVAGSAALPSTAQLYVNGIQQSQQPLQPGQFRFDSVPTLTGAGDLSVVIRDSLGRLQTVTQPFYTSPRLLAPGLDAVTFESGFLRDNYAVTDDHYAQGFLATTLQHGYTGNFTGLLRASASAHRQLGGIEGDYIVSPFGVFTVSGALSHTESGTGGVGTLGFVRQSDFLSLSLSRRAASRDYGDLGRDPGSLHFSDTARVSLNMHRSGIGSVVYISEVPWINGLQGVAARLAGVSWNIEAWNNSAAYVSVLHTLTSPRDNTLVVGFSMSFGKHTSGSLQWAHDAQSGGGANVALQHSPAEQLGWSYAASANTQEGGLRQVQALLTTERGSFGAGWAGFDGSSSPSLTAQTGLAFLDGHTYWTRPVQNSFAVVDAGNAAGVDVYRENQRVGTTNSNGRLLVPDLLPFSVNRLSVDDSALPIATGLTSTNEQISPPANAGVPVHFKVDSRPATRLQLIQDAGDVVPAGASLWLDGHELPLPVGYDGLVYADITDGRHVLEAHWSEGSCRVRLEVLASKAHMEFCSRAVP